LCLLNVKIVRLFLLKFFAADWIMDRVDVFFEKNSGT
jgi:hypothetical protein